MTNFAFDPSRKFLDPEQVLFAAGLSIGQSFGDLGSGSGFYTLAAAKIVGEQGVVYTVDILESALDHISAEARLKNVRNVKTIICDLEKPGGCQEIAAGTLDMVLLANITHQIKQADNLFAESYRMLKSGGKLLVIEWNDQPGPIGPAAASRIAETEVKSLAKTAAFKNAGDLKMDAYHYGLVFIK